MRNFSGNIFSGEVDEFKDSFYLTQVKNLQTASNLSESKLMQLSHYLSCQKDSCMITVNDQIPILLQEKEVAELLVDIAKIMDAIKTS